MNKKYNLILASQSPRRKELLSWLNIPFEIIPSKIDEETDYKLPNEMAMDLAGVKGKDIFNICSKNPEMGKTYFPIVVSADTLVSLDEKVLGKPQSLSDAKDMLMLLSGKKHKVTTGVYIKLYTNQNEAIKERTFYVETVVEFSKITSDLLEDYLKTKDSLDKAGAYGIQNQAQTFIKNLNGSYSNVVGFPLHEFIEEIKLILGYGNDTKGEWKSLFN